MNKNRNGAARLMMIFWLAALALQAGAQVIDLEAQRQPVTSIASNWRFHPGDDSSWAKAGFDDSGWKLIQPATDWAAQGYSEKDGLAWFRFRLRVPAHTASIVVQLPRIDKSYQFFADGLLIGQTGGLPPQRPHSVVGAARLYTVPIQNAAHAQEVTLALRLWQARNLVGISQSVLRGKALAGDPAALLPQFANNQAAALLIQRGNEYTQALIVMVIGAATLMLFFLNREAFYLWFALNMAMIAVNLPIRLLSQHFAWDYHFCLYLYIFTDFMAGASFALFLLGALNLYSWRYVALPLLLSFLGELGPLLLILYQLPLIWADGIYVLFITASDAVVFWYLLRGWRRGMVDAKLLLIPYAVGMALGEAGNLGHYLVDLNLPLGDKLLNANVDLVRAPFAISLNDAGNMLTLLGLLAVLVYRFARTSRDQQRLATALQAAHDIQQRLVPVDIPSLGGLHTEISYLAAEEVGGDFCQVLPRPDGSILVAIGDVSGKGLQAAMLGTLAVGALRCMAEEDIEPCEALQRLNHVVLRTDNAGFITCLCLKLSPEGVVTLANAGHLSPYLNGEEIYVEAGLPLGILPEIEYEQSMLLLPESARLTLLSDGVVEARSRTGELFGFDRTSKISQLTASQIVAAAHRYGQQDDITVITLDWQAPMMELMTA